jgi:uroporphyrinogen decarboxylase
MAEMTSRERVLRTFRFEETDRAPFDLMESIVWPGLQQWCAQNLGLANPEAVLSHFGCDFRWFWPWPKAPEGVDLNDTKYTMPFSGTYSDHAQARPLADVHSVDEMLRRHAWTEAEWWDFTPVHDLRARHPDKATVMLVHTTMLFMSACDFFGIEETLVRLAQEDEILLEFLERQSDYSVKLLGHACREARHSADICWLMDDVGTQSGLMMGPELWRRHFKDLQRRQVEAVHQHGLYAMFHSCGAVSEILPDLIEIGMDAVLPFQTTADGMEPETIARDFGGKLVFYGGMDVQQLLTYGSEEDVRREVRRNLQCFEGKGGYIVANSHHCIENIKPENVCTMLDEAAKPHAMRRR